jgi:zinc transport system ATP-binding protein
LSKSFDRRNVLTDVSLVLHRGEIMTLIGPNGAGKSTLVKMLLGVVSPDSGSVTCADHLSVGYVPQKLHIDPSFPLTVARLMRLKAKASTDEIKVALARTGVASLIDASVQKLSGGELQRVLLARAILHKPDLLVLDEPAQGVDFNGEAELYQLISVIRDELQCAVLMVSHDLHIVMAATDKVICVNGHICCSGSPETISVHPEYLQLFGEKSANILGVYSHKHDHEHSVCDHEH